MIAKSPTGRIAAQPNMQGIPIRTPEGAQIREALASAPDLTNPNREPVISLYDLATLDDAEQLEGYRDGTEGYACGGNRSRSYWHGWRQGSRDSGRREGDIWDKMLTMTVIPGGRGWTDLPARVENLRKLLDRPTKVSVDRTAE